MDVFNEVPHRAPADMGKLEAFNFLAMTIILASRNFADGKEFGGKHGVLMMTDHDISDARHESTRRPAVMTERAPSRSRLRGFAIAALIIFAIAAAIFIGLNIWHAGEAAG